MAPDRDVDADRTTAFAERLLGGRERRDRIRGLREDVHGVHRRIRDVGEREQEPVDLEHLRARDVGPARSLGFGEPDRDPLPHVHVPIVPGGCRPVGSLDASGPLRVRGLRRHRLEVDVTASLLATFGDPSWHTYDEAFARGEIGLRESIQAQDRMLDADRDTLTAFAIEHVVSSIRRSRRSSAWCESNGLEVAIVSDGFALLHRADAARGGARSR